jgi:hypothetical protein
MGKLLACISTPPDQRFGYCIKGIGTERLQFFRLPSRVELTVGGYLTNHNLSLEDAWEISLTRQATIRPAPLIYNKQKRTTEIMRSIKKKLYLYSLNVPNSFQSYPVAETNHLSSTEHRDRLYIKG